MNEESKTQLIECYIQLPNLESHGRFPRQSWISSWWFFSICFYNILNSEQYPIFRMVPSRKIEKLLLLYY